MTYTIFLKDKKLTQKAEGLVKKYLDKRGINTNTVLFASMEHRMGDTPYVEKRGKIKVIAEKKSSKLFFNLLDDYIDSLGCKLFFCNDPIALDYITGFKQNLSLNQHRGSVYFYRDIPIVVLDDITLVHRVKQYSWIMLSDIEKGKRWRDGETRSQVNFEYTRVKGDDDLHKLRNCASNSILCACDNETAHNFITCTNFTFLTNEGRIESFTVPFYSTITDDGCYWREEDSEIFAWTVIKEILENPDLPKIFQNGCYDCAWFIRYHIAVRNYYIDTMHMFHSIWCESEKSLGFIATMMLDHVQYWKDDIKGDKKTRDKVEKVPQTAKGLEIYWRYNALDGYYTLMAATYLVFRLVNPTMVWALKNYVQEFEDQVGPYYAMTMTGMKVDRKRQKYKKKQWMRDHEQQLRELRVWVDDPDFNPNSQPEYASLLYDVLGAKPIVSGRGKHKTPERSVDKRITRLIKRQHSLLEWTIDRVNETKEPLNKITKYGDMYCPYDRFLYNISRTTETSRTSGRNHHYWIGTNPQNIDKPTRDMFIADKGFFFFDPDYSQSDSWFVAFESQDPDYMRNVQDERDTHCLHAEKFFGIPYDEVFKGHLEEADWCEDPIEGVRQNTKRITHGASYRMGGYTLYQLMGFEAVIATARKMGYNNAHLWPQKQLVSFCDALLGTFFKMYGRLPDWFNDIAISAVQQGNKATCYGGYTRFFFGDILDDQAVQRELSAFYGQGGTGGNVNRTLRTLFYNSDLRDLGVKFHLQVHDDLLFGIPFDSQYHDICKYILTVMQEPVTIHGRTFSVPTDAKCGLSWGKAMLNYNDTVRIEDMISFEHRWVRDKYNDFAEAA